MSMSCPVGAFWTWPILNMAHSENAAQRFLHYVDTCINATLSDIYLRWGREQGSKKERNEKKWRLTQTNLNLKTAAARFEWKKNEARFCCQLWLMKWVDFRPERAILLSAFEIIIIWHEMTKMLILLYWFRIGKKGSPTGLADIAHW